MVLLLGPPGSGKTTLLLSLVGRLDKNLQVSGKITYCGHELSEFVPQRTCAYVSQDDLHNEQMTVRETLDFSGRCLGERRKQVTIEITYIVVQSLLYGLLLFWMIGFGWQADKLFWFLYFIFMSLIYFTLYGMMVVALTPSHLVANIVIPIWWRWYYWADSVAWTVYGIVASQLGDKYGMVKIPGKSSMPVKAYLNENLGFEHSFVGYAVLAHVGFVLLFTFLFAYAIKSLNFQKRYSSVKGTSLEGVQLKGGAPTFMSCY